jgi:hypothetical protein
MSNARGLLLGALLILLLPGCEPATHIGDPCQLDPHCGGREDNLDLECDNTIPGGSCTVADCTLDDPATAGAEDASSCPSGSRCVQECKVEVKCQTIGGQQSCAWACKSDGSTALRCRRACQQQSDCREVIVCGPKCEMVEDQEVCHQECTNHSECVRFWPLPSSELDELTDAPRACVQKGTLVTPEGE